MRDPHPTSSVGRSIGVALVLAWATSAIVAAAGEVAPAWRDKVHPRALRDVEAGTGEFIVFLGDQADVRVVGRNAGKHERTSRVVALLREHALRTQAPLLALLEARGIEHRGFWIANMIWVRGDAAMLERLARRPEVLRIDPNAPMRMEPSVPVEAAAKSAAAVEWNILRIAADAAWQMGFDGEGVVIGAQDTGFQWQHPALIGQYRGWNGTAASHDHNWHDAIHSGGGFCGPNSPQPCDDDSHGTHVMGILVGDDLGLNQIGVAPGARWIGCRNMDQAVGTPATYTECFQWMVAPTDLAGNNPDPRLAPDVISNSWVCLVSEGCAPDTLRLVVENTRAAGIVVVAAAGNTGPGCSTVSTPIGNYDASFTAGATDSLDLVYFRSSRGPVLYDGSGRRKPDVAAPGVAVRSSVPFDSYHAFSGTSMATAHVAGLVALLLDARPDLAGRVDEIETLIATSALPLTTLDGCGSDTPSSVPNNTFGWGRIDAERLFTQDADADGAANLADCLPLDPDQWSAPGAAGSLTFDPDRSTLTWSPPAAPGASEIRYDLLRSSTAEDLGGITCVAQATSSTSATDLTLPAQIFFYLVRTLNDCGSSLGHSTLGPRSAPPC